MFTLVALFTVDLLRIYRVTPYSHHKKSNGVEAMTQELVSIRRRISVLAAWILVSSAYHDVIFTVPSDQLRNPSRGECTR